MYVTDHYYCRAKHPCKVHVWAGISCRGKTQIVIFDGLMNGAGLIEVFEAGLLPFINDNRNIRFMQDNDPKHASRRVGEWLERNNINWWKTPAESPDINPIENMWHELKEHIRRVTKPKTKQELVSGILSFWDTVDVPKCRKYIGHLKKVIPEIIKQNGGPTGY